MIYYMVIHHTRTNLLLLREKALSVGNSVEILKARRVALIQEFMNTTLPFLRTRKDISGAYGRALDELALSLGRMGRVGVESITFVTKRDINIEIKEKSIWGLKYKDVEVHEGPFRDPSERGYEIANTTPHLEECIHLFEKVLDSMLEIADYESKLKRLSHEITRITRKIKVLEEKILPDLKYQIRTIAHYISERERETYFRVKKFKELHG